VDSQLVSSATILRMDCVDIHRHNHSTAPEIYIFKEIPFRYTYILISWMLNQLKDYFDLDTWRQELVIKMCKVDDFWVNNSRSMRYLV